MITGHTTVWNMLSNSASSKRLHHALLFWGPPGTGKITFALELAKLLNCNQLHEGHPCGDCRNCRRLRFPFPFHPDVRLLRDNSVPLFMTSERIIQQFLTENIRHSRVDTEQLLENYTEGLNRFLQDETFSGHTVCRYANPSVDILTLNSDKPLTAAQVDKHDRDPLVYWMAQKLLLYQKTVCYNRTIKIDNVREIQKVLYLHTCESVHKIVIIDDADHMLVPAQNSLLKILEEPPQNALIILVAGNPKTLLPTIRSRCQSVPFFRIATADLSAGLRNRFGFDDHHADKIARRARGSFAAALTTDWEKETLYSDMFNRLFSNGNLKGLDWILTLSNELFSLDNTNGRNALTRLYQWLHERICANPDAGILEGQLPGCRPFSPDAALRLLDGIEDILNHDVYNFDTKLQFEAMLAKFLKELSLHQ